MASKARDIMSSLRSRMTLVQVAELLSEVFGLIGRRSKRVCPDEESDDCHSRHSAKKSTEFHTHPQPTPSTPSTKRTIPLLAEEGWPRPQTNIVKPPLRERTGLSDRHQIQAV